MRKLSLEHLDIYQTLCSIRHPHIAEVLDVFPYQDDLYVIEEYLAGKPWLNSWKKKGQWAGACHREAAFRRPCIPSQKPYHPP